MTFKAVNNLIFKKNVNISKITTIISRKFVRPFDALILKCADSRVHDVMSGSNGTCFVVQLINIPVLTFI